MFALDATGETGWLYGREDVAGDGLDVFKQQEQSIDIRTAYASTDAQRFWVRVYVSDTNTAGGNVTAYVFIDSDKSGSTGGKAAGTEIDARFTTDASPGGYDYVLRIRGNGSITDVWEWNSATSLYETFNVNPQQASAEAGTFTDPIRINGDVHGYLQANINLNLVALTQACSANLYVRTTNETAALGAGDLEVGVVGPCVPADGNNDGIVDITVPKTACTDDSQCANGGICVSGKCVQSSACAVDADCGAGRTCQNGRCVVVPSGTCQTNADCSGLLCTSGQCVACTPGGSECGAGKRCGPDGRCVNASGTGSAGSGGLAVAPGEEIQGGACNCGLAGRRVPGNALLLCVLLPLISVVRRQRTRRPAAPAR